MVIWVIETNGDAGTGCDAASVKKKEKHRGVTGGETFRGLALGANTLDLIRLEVLKMTPPSLSCLTLYVSYPTSNRLVLFHTQQCDASLRGRRPDGIITASPSRIQVYTAHHLFLPFSPGLGRPVFPAVRSARVADTGWNSGVFSEAVHASTCQS